MKKLSFSEYLKEYSDTVYFTFGRMNPPTCGHEKLCDFLSEQAGKNPYKIYLSHTTDKKKNPLLYEDKLKIARKVFPKHSRHIVESEANNILQVASSLYEKNYKNIVMVCGSDRELEFKERLNLYNGKEGIHGFYVFESIKVISAGDRDPDSSSINSNISASQLREAVKQSNFIGFTHGLPQNVTNEDARSLYNKIRSGLGLTEETQFKPDLKLNNDVIREQYISGNLFSIDDDVIIKENNELAKIINLGTNYVIVESNDGKRYRKWIKDIEKVER